MSSMSPPSPSKGSKKGFLSLFRKGTTNDNNNNDKKPESDSSLESFGSGTPKNKNGPSLNYKDFKESSDKNFQPQEGMDTTVISQRATTVEFSSSSRFLTPVEREDSVKALENQQEIALIL